MGNKHVLDEIEELRKQLNDHYKQNSVITPELLELSVKLDLLLNKWQLQS